jgi:acyl carrier protein
MPSGTSLHSSDRRMYKDQIRDILARHGRLSIDVAEISDDSDLYQAGLTSLITVNLLLAIEDHFDVEFPDALLSRRTFQSIGALAEAVEELVA